MILWVGRQGFSPIGHDLVFAESVIVIRKTVLGWPEKVQRAGEP